MHEKLIGFAVLAVIFYIIFFILKNHTRGFVSAIRNNSPVHIGALLAFAFTAFSKTIDGLDRKLSSLNISIDAQTSAYFVLVEEVLELGIPLLITVTFLIFCQQQQRLTESEKKK